TVQPQCLDSKVTWIAPASSGQAVEITIFLCDGHFGNGEWPACRTMGTQPVGRFDIDGGGEVWIVYRHVKALAYQPLKHARPHYFKGASESDALGSGNRMLAWGRHDDGSIVFHDLIVTVTKDQPTTEANHVGN